MKNTYSKIFSYVAIALALTALSGLAEASPTYSVRVDGVISSPQLSIIKRAIRAANSDGAKVLILDMNTPGGDLDTTLKIMDALSNFNGKTVCYVNSDAISAGSFIACACDEIWFSPRGVMGAAEAVTMTGGDIDNSMRRKLTSFLGAKVRAANSDNSRRSDVQRAMNDPDFVFKIGDRTIKNKGELLSLTAAEAVEKINGIPLLANGIAENIEQLAEKLTENSKDSELKKLKITWAESCAKYMSSLSPLILGVAFFLVFIDIKSGSLGLFSIVGVVLALIVFVGANMSGLAGYEAFLVFILGAFLLFGELFFFPGVVIPALIGCVLMVGSLIWALGDVWLPRGLEYNMHGILIAAGKVMGGIVIAVLALLAFGRFLASKSAWRGFVLSSAQTGASPSEIVAEIHVGDKGVAETPLSPSGRIRVNGIIADATSVFGPIASGDKIEIVAKKDFYFIVKKS